VAGNPSGSVFVPADLTPEHLVSGGTFLPAVQMETAGDRFRAASGLVFGDVGMPEPGAWTPGGMFILASEDWLAGEVFFPALDGSSKDLGRLLFARGAGAQRTDLLVTGLGDTAFTVGHAPASSVAHGGILAAADTGELDASVALCGERFGARLGAGDSAAFKCGSLTTEVLTGAVVVELADGTLLDVPEGATVHVEEQDAGGWNVTVVSGSGVVATVAGEPYTLDEGDTLDTANPDPDPDPDPAGFVFEGFMSPISMSSGEVIVWNTVKAGQAVPAKWRLMQGGVPVSSLQSFMGLQSVSVDCNASAWSIDDALDETAPGGSGLTYLGDGTFQFNWKTPKSYSGGCRVMVVQFSDGSSSPGAFFKFK
jgi:hypothetical protein